MTLQQLKYVIEVANRGSMNEAAKRLFISQPSLSNAIRELENELGISIFERTNKGIVLSKDGAEFLGYARQVIEQAELLEGRYLNAKPSPQHFSVSTQHYAFAVNAFVRLVQTYGLDEYELALREKRRKVTIVHKANILKSTSGLFLKIAREIAKKYPSIETNEMIVDNTCMQLVMNPHQFDVIVTTNLFGDIISDLCAGLVGGLGMAPGANIGKDYAIFEAVHGSAPDIAGKNIANPSSMILAAIQMLHHLQLTEPAERISRALRETILAGDRTTPDLGGSGSTTDFTHAVISRL
mgnify:CR=1 FL=1